LINHLARSTSSKSFNKGDIKSRTILSKSQNKNKKCQYNLDIDRAILDEFDVCQLISYGELKRRVEKSLSRNLSYSTFTAHLQRMLNEKELKKDEKRVDGVDKVLYSVTEETKKRGQLRLLRIDPKHEVFKEILTNLFLRGMTEGGTYASNNLDELLSDIHATRQDLVVDHIEEKHSEYDMESELVNVQEKILSVSLTTYYKPVSGVRITETTSYRENIFYHFYTECTMYFCTIPGTSIKEFATTYYTFKPKLEDVEEAFILLMKNHLIKPIIEFRGETKYGFADGGLNELMTDLYSYHVLEKEYSCEKWNYIIEPTYEERESRRAFFTDKNAAETFFNIAEINRFDFKKKARENIPLLKELQENLNKWENAKMLYLKHMREKHEKTINEYAFLLPDIFRIVCPSLLQDPPTTS
jgi:DNA-binding transcriptional ArsR family regulator